MISSAAIAPSRGAAACRARLLIAFPLLAILAAVGCTKNQQSNKEQLLSRANAAFAADQYAQAEKDYQQLLRLHPDDPTAFRNLGIIYQSQGQTPQAYTTLKKAAELQPDDPEVQLRFGLTLLVQKEFVRARDAALQILENDPGHEKALLLLVHASTTDAEIEDARSLIADFRDKNGERAAYHLALSKLDLWRNDRIHAEDQLKTAVSLDAKSSEIYSALGSLYWSSNDIKAADEAFQKAVELSSLRAPVRLVYAEFKLQTGSPAEAKAMWQELAGKLPDYLPPRVSLMKFACTENRDADCMARIKDILAQDSINFDALRGNGLISLAQGDAREAIRSFELLVQTHPPTAEIRHQLALAYLQHAKTVTPVESKGLVTRAEAALGEAVALDPHFAPAVLLLSELKINKGAAPAVVSSLLELAKERPPIAEAHYSLARAYLAQQNTRQALSVFREMTELFPDDPEPHALIGTILLRQRQTREARAAFTRATEISPEFLLALEMLVDLDIAEGQPAAALARVQNQLDKNSSRAELWALRGKIHLAKFDFSRAEPDLLKAIELDPKLQSVYVLLSQLYVATNRQEQAIERLKASIAESKSLPPLLLLASIQEELKNFAAARDAYEQMLTVSRNFVPALNNLAFIYSEHLGQLDKARELAKRARDSAPNDPAVTDTLGWILFKNGEFTEAARLLQEALARLPDNPEVQFHAGMAHYMLGEEEPARLNLQKAVDSNADFPGKDNARQRLALLATDAGTASAGGRMALENYLQNEPDDPVALVRLALVQQHDGAIEQATKTYERVLAAYPQFAPAMRQLAVINAPHSTDVAKAFELAQRAYQTYPGDPEVAKALGIASYRRASHGRALELLKEAANKLPNDAELLYYLGATSVELKQRRDCKPVLESALSLRPPRDLADKVRRSLAQCAELSP
jgi:tetratricopeptide (TPR) repeat protein